jgi:hypothetical protein
MDARENMLSDARPPTGLTAIQIRQGHPDFLDLPWQLSLVEWEGKSNRLGQVPRGLSRHEVLFVAYGKVIYALKDHERIRALNELGFSVGEVDLVASGDSDHLRMRTILTDRNYHRHQLHNLTGIVAEERQATLLLNEIQELKATLTRELNRSIPLSTAAFRWMEERFRPTLQKLQPVRGATALSELYCQVLEHKWFLSERAKKDVGLERAIEDYVELRKRQKGPSAAPFLPGGPATPSLPRLPGIREADGSQEPVPQAEARTVDSSDGGR